MIVYRDQRYRTDPYRLLSKLRSTADRFVSGSPATHDVVVASLIEAGTLESALADALFPDSDGLHPLATRLRDASSALGHVLWHSWHGRPAAGQPWWDRLSTTLSQLALLQLPCSVEPSVPEGYAYYAVYPEMYLEAAKRYHARYGAADAICLGLRTIGTSLSAVIAAALEELGCRVASFTLRPRGHPSSRHLVLGAELETVLRSHSKAHFLVIDEGPGISGSSLGGTAAMLQALGIPDDRIILFPSWATDGSQLQSAPAREHWSRHPQFTVSFEDLWLQSNRWSGALPGQLRDISAGGWRRELYQNPERYPPVQPQHERRKYLLRPIDATAGQQAKLLSFLGLGEYSVAKLKRGERLAEAGFTPKPEAVVHGFLVRPFVPGTPVSAENAGRPLVEWTANYLAHLCREHPAQPTVSDESLRQMSLQNVAEGLGDAWGARLRARIRSEGWTERPVALDGRMLAHEWIRTPGGYLKTDAIDHHQDHFFPGCQDIAWDVAAAALELRLNAEARRELIARYRSLSGDHTITSRIPAYAAFYLAFRLGYATLAASVLGQDPDADRFAGAACRYACLLRRELSDPHGRGWNG
jgi:hypothetical protein